MKKYSKLWKNLFHKYSNFDQLGQRNQILTYPEMTQLLKDHGMLPVYLTKDELGVLFKLINVKLGTR